ncbi:MAG: hypothetical protein AM326_01730 [Candidatus Thorarchaeota archaeon SMTZ-45]|nr:MAG: hypothetical protein AM326_01730 [Candidatus Thorarchaeota archaeon SMTZ-45]
MISEIKIEGCDLDAGDNFKDLFQCYKEILIEDPIWHFFREGDYTLIRCEDNTVGPVTKYLEDKMGIMPGQITVTEEWEDNIKATRRHQEAYAHIFHGFSMLAMMLYEEEMQYSANEAMERFIGTFDRIVHCFLNIARSDKKIKGFTPFIPVKKADHVGGIWESALIMHNALMRMYTIGNYSGKRQMQSVIEDMFNKE